jgi:hypothetical protein
VRRLRLVRIRAWVTNCTSEMREMPTMTRGDETANDPLQKSNNSKADFEISKSTGKLHAHVF